MRSLTCTYNQQIHSLRSGSLSEEVKAKRGQEKQCRNRSEPVFWIQIRIRIQHFSLFSSEFRTRSGSGSRVLMTKTWKKQLKNIFFFIIKICNLLIPKPPKWTSKLQEKPSALKREHPALQKITFINFFSIFVGRFCPPRSTTHIAPWQQKFGREWEEDYPVPVHNVYAVWLGVRDMLLHEAAEPGEVGRDARDTCNHNRVKSPKFIWASCVQLYLFGWDPATPPRIWAHIRGRYWLAKIDDISLWPPACNHRTKVKGKIHSSFAVIWFHPPSNCQPHLLHRE